MTLLSIFLLLSGVPSWAQNKSLSSPVRVQHETIRSNSMKKKLKTKNSKQQNPDMTDKLVDKKNLAIQQRKEPKWGFMLNYRVASDLQERQSSKTLGHELGAGLQYRMLDNLYVQLGISANYDSEGSEVLVDGQQTEAYMGDVSLGVSSRIQQINWSVDNEFPTSPYSRAEGYLSVTQGSVTYSYRFLERFSISPGLLGYYIWNRYEKSPTLLVTNKMGSLRGSLLLGVKIWQGLSFRIGGGIQATRYTDGTNDTASRNSIGFGYTFRNLTTGLDFSNGTYADREETQFWFVDKYRRIVSLRLALSF